MNWQLLTKQRDKSQSSYFLSRLLSLVSFLTCVSILVSVLIREKKKDEKLTFLSFYRALGHCVVVILIFVLFSPAFLKSHYVLKETERDGQNQKQKKTNKKKKKKERKKRICVECRRRRWRKGICICIVSFLERERTGQVIMKEEETRDMHTPYTRFPLYSTLLSSLSSSAMRKRRCNM